MARTVKPSKPSYNPKNWTLLIPGPGSQDPQGNKGHQAKNGTHNKNRVSQYA
jgi:hypothetical protein